MGFWAWFWIWTGLSVAATVFLALIGKSIFNSGADVLHQVSRIMPKFEELISALAPSTSTPERESNLLDSVEDLETKRALFLRQKSKKEAKRQRSLRSALKHIDVNESRFTND